MPDLSQEEVLKRLGMSSSKQPIDYNAIEEARRKKSKTEQYQEALKGTNIPPREDLAISASSWKDTFRNFVSPFIQGAMVGVPAAIGTAFRGPLGGVLAGSLGDQAYQVSQRLDPRLFGLPPSNLLESLKSTAFNVGIDRGLVQGVPLVRNAVGSALMKKYFPIDPLRPVQVGLEAEPNFEVTVPQFTQSKAAQTMLNLFVPKREVEKIYARQQGQLTSQANRELRNISPTLTISGKTVPTSREIATTPQLAKLSSEAAEKSYETSKAFKNSLYQEAEDVQIPKVQTPVFWVKESPGRITNKPFFEEIHGVSNGGTPIVHTQDFAKEILNEMDSKLSQFSDYGKDPKVRAGLQQIKDRVKTYLDVPLSVSSDPLPIMEYNTIKLNKEILNRMLSGTDQEVVFPSREKAIIQTLRDMLGKDTNLAASPKIAGEPGSGFWPSEVGKAYRRATDYNAAMVKRYFGETPGARFYLGNKNLDINLEQLTSESLKTAQGAKSAVKGIGSRTPLALEFTEKGFRESFDPTTGVWNGNKFVNYLTDNKDVAGVVLNSDQRNALKLLSRRMQAVMPYQSEMGKTALMIRLGGAAIGISSGLLYGAGTGQVTPGLITGGLLWASFELGRSQIRPLLLNPANTRLFSELLVQRPGSPPAEHIAKKLFRGALRGTRFMVQYQQDMPPVEMEAREDGKLHPTKQPEFDPRQWIQR